MYEDAHLESMYESAQGSDVDDLIEDGYGYDEEEDEDDE